MGGNLPDQSILVGKSSIGGSNIRLLGNIKYPKEFYDMVEFPREFY